MNKTKDISGQRFGLLSVISRAGTDKYHATTWLCRCDCGRDCIVSGVQMRRGHVKSCGCLNNAENRKDRTLEHGKSDSRLYRVWATMKSRCSNSKTARFDRYGGRGISVCEEWQNSFQAFYDWAMSNGYDENAPQGKCTIDRIDNNKGYYPENCRWVDQKTQNKNRGS